MMMICTERNVCNGNVISVTTDSSRGYSTVTYLQVSRLGATSGTRYSKTENESEGWRDVEEKKRHKSRTYMTRGERERVAVTERKT